MASFRAEENDLITAKEIMKEFDVSYQIVNHYTNFGLLPVLIKKANIRYYDKNTVKGRLKKIRELTQQGYSLSLIRKKLDEDAVILNGQMAAQEIKTQQQI
jgi:DNA-binding transcriptional MerR regulator